MFTFTWGTWLAHLRNMPRSPEEHAHSSPAGVGVRGGRADRGLVEVALTAVALGAEHRTTDEAEGGGTAVVSVRTGAAATRGYDTGLNWWLNCWLKYGLNWWLNWWLNCCLNCWLNFWLKYCLNCWLNYWLKYCLKYWQAPNYELIL